MVIVVFLFMGCAAGPNDMVNTKPEEEDRDVVGFLHGFWHGLITPVTFIISLFSKHVNIYEVHNNGGWYNFGFVLGLMMIFGGSGGGAGRKICFKKEE